MDGRVGVAAGMLLVAVVVGGCRGGGSDGQSTASSPSTETAERTLQETCPEAEAAFPDDTLSASGQRLRRLQQDLEQLSDAGDTETRNALAPMIKAVPVLVDADDPLEYLDAEEGFDGALVLLKERCRAAGSSAFQG